MIAIAPSDNPSMPSCSRARTWLVAVSRLPISNHLVDVVAKLGWHYLSNATCLIRPHLFSKALLV